MNSLWDIRIFLGLVPKESPCISYSCQQYKRKLWSSCKVSDSVVRFYPNLDFLDIFRKVSNITLHENPPVWSPVDIRWQTEQHYEANSYFSRLKRRRLKKGVLLEHIKFINILFTILNICLPHHWSGCSFATQISLHLHSQSQCRYKTLHSQKRFPSKYMAYVKNDSSKFTNLNKNHISYHVSLFFGASTVAFAASWPVGCLCFYKTT